MNPSERPPEKSNYSYKEMMERLRRERRSGGAASREREGGGGDSSGGSQKRRSLDPAGQQQPGRVSGSISGNVSTLSGSRKSEAVRTEVIENPDGTQQVAEVRKRRKRRSHQPKKAKEQRRMKLQRNLVLIFVPLVALIVGGYLLLLGRVKNESFREGASARLSELSGANLKFGEFKMRGLVPELYSRKVVLEDVPGSFIRGGEVHALKGKLSHSSLVSSDWKLGVVQSSDGVIRLGLPSGAAAIAAGGDSHRDGAIGLDPGPKRVHVEGFRLGGSDLVWDNGRPGGVPLVTGASIETGKTGSTPFELSLRGGKLSIPSWPEFGIQMISGDASNGVFDIRQSLLEHVERGTAKLSGRVGFTGQGTYQFEVGYTDIKVREVVHPFWMDKLGGEIDGDLNIQGSLASPGSLKAEGSFKGDDFVISNNNILKGLSLGLGEALLARIEFKTFSGRYRRGAGRTEFYDLNGAHTSLFQVRGAITVFDDERLEGALEIGIPETILSKVEGGRPPFFGRSLDGFSWTKVRVFGLVDEPQEDLIKKLEEYRQQRQPAAGAPTEDAFEKLLRSNNE